MVIITGRGHGERTGLGLRSGQAEGDGVPAYGPGQRAAIILGRIRKGDLPGPRQRGRITAAGPQERERYGEDQASRRPPPCRALLRGSELYSKGLRCPLCGVMLYRFLLSEALIYVPYPTRRRSPAYAIAF